MSNAEGIARRWIVTVADADADPPEKSFGPYTEAQAISLQERLVGKLRVLGYREGDPPYVWVVELRPFGGSEDEYGVTGDESVFLRHALGRFA